MHRGMERHVALIGFGEAGSTFATAGGWRGEARVFDIKTEETAEREGMLARYAGAGVHGAASIAEALDGAPLVLSLVTADQALTAAEAAAHMLVPDAIYCDLNSVAPDTKRAAARAIEGAGGRYVDVAVMAPVDPARLAVPLLLSGSDAAGAQAALASLGFSDLRIVGDAVGRASSIKMIRSVMVKGIEALSAECVLAASRAGVLDEVLASLDASEKPRPWAGRADYNLDRMLVHGLRRAAEMEEVAKTLSDLGIAPLMTAGTIARQRGIGSIGTKEPVAGLQAKIDTIAINEGTRSA